MYIYPLCLFRFIVLALPFAVFGLDNKLGTAKSKNSRLADIFDFKNPNLNWLSFARLFLFASRDFWFEVRVAYIYIYVCIYICIYV